MSFGFSIESEFEASSILVYVALTPLLSTPKHRKYMDKPDLAKLKIKPKHLSAFKFNLV